MKKQSTFINKPWKHAAVAAFSLAVSYAFVSWGIDSGRLTAYFGAVVCGILAINHAAKAMKGYAKQN
jgi:hypothetical protein